MVRFAEVQIKVQDATRTRQIARSEYARATSQAKFEAIQAKAARNAKSFSAPRTWALA